MSVELVRVWEVSTDFLSRLRDRTLMIRISSGLTKYVNMQFLKWVERNARSEFFPLVFVENYRTVVHSIASLLVTN